MTQENQDAKVRLIRKYPNRRLYDTATSTYITLTEIKTFLLDGADFRVEDSKTKEDVTRSILLQVILEEESSGAPLFSNDVLKQFIRFYGHAMQGHFEQYLGKSLQVFADTQNAIQEQTKKMVELNPMLNPELMAQFMTGKAGKLPDSMGAYLEQSASNFMEMQKKLQQQAQQFFGTMPEGAASWFGAKPPESNAGTSENKSEDEKK